MQIKNIRKDSKMLLFVRKGSTTQYANREPAYTKWCIKRPKRQLSEPDMLMDLSTLTTDQTGKYVARAEDLPRASQLPCVQRLIKRAEFEQYT